MKNNWEEKTLEEVCEKIEFGKTPSRADKSLWDNSSKNIWVSISDLSNTIDKCVYDSKEHISNKILNNMRIVKKGTLLLSFKLTIGRVAFAGKDLYTNEAIVQLPVKKQYLIKEFLYYYLQFFNYDILLRGDVKVKGKTLNKEKLKKLPVIFPTDINEQKRIVERLDKAFENIDKLTEISKKNLDNAKELFDSYLNKLFTENTENWEETTLNDICEKIFAGGDKPLNFCEIKNERYKIPVFANGIKNDGLLGYTDNPTVKENAITISARGTIGFVCKRYEPFCPIVRLIVIIPKTNKVNIDFLYYLSKILIPNSNGSSIPQLTIPKFKDSIIKLPPLPQQKQIVKILDDLQEKTKKLEEIYNKKLELARELKQSILHKELS